MTVAVTLADGGLVGGGFVGVDFAILSANPAALQGFKDEVGGRPSSGAGAVVRLCCPTSVK